MMTISATDVKQNFGSALAAARQEPVAIERHGRIVALMVPPKDAPDERRERLAARRDQALVDARRLIKHQRIAIDLLRSPSAAAARVGAALAEVQRWEDHKVCSPHFIERWRALLRLPIPELAGQMAGDAEGWGAALRQNSPWIGPA